MSIATLYRHFPQRDTLVAAARDLSVEREPIDALREWLLMFVDFLDTKHGMSDVLGTLLRGSDALFRDSTERLSSSVAVLIRRAQGSAALEAGIDPVDLLRAIGGIANVNPAPDWRDSAVRLVDVLLRGLRSDDVSSASDAQVPSDRKTSH